MDLFHVLPYSLKVLIHIVAGRTAIISLRVRTPTVHPREKCYLTIVVWATLYNTETEYKASESKISKKPLNFYHMYALCADILCALYQSSLSSFC